VITDKTFGHATYGCWECCAIDDSTWMEADPSGVAVGDSVPFRTKGTNTCSGLEQDLTGNSYNWTTNDAAIAGAAFALGTGVAAGDTLH
jgi:hypothetical protein